MRQRPRNRSRRGVTLLELIVVIALLGLIIALAAPAMILPEERHEPELNAIIDQARRAALVRGEPVTLTVDDARWRIDGDASVAASSIASGNTAQATPRLRLRISPLGTCMIDANAGSTPVDWNALDCRITVARRAP